MDDNTKPLTVIAILSLLAAGLCILLPLCFIDISSEEDNSYRTYASDLWYNSDQIKLPSSQNQETTDNTDNSESKKEDEYTPNYVWFSKKKDKDMVSWFSSIAENSSKTEEKDEVSTQKYKIYYETKFLYHRGNVGSEWGFYLKDGSNIIESGDFISAKGNLELTAVAVEYDDSSNDTGTATIKIAHTEDFPTIKTVNVTVKERYGKDAGSTAEIKFTIKIVKE